MAHVRVFGFAAPAAKGIIHWGATSAFVADNGDLIQMREALSLSERRLVEVLKRLRAFALAHRDLPVLAYTHFQPAQPTTAGKRRGDVERGPSLRPGGDPRRAREPPVPGSQGSHRHAGVLPVPLRRRLVPGRGARPRPRGPGGLRETRRRLGTDLLAKAGRHGPARPLRPRPIGAQDRDGPAPAPARRRDRGALGELSGGLLRHAAQEEPDARREDLRPRAPRHRPLARHGHDRLDAMARAESRRFRQQAHRACPRRSSPPTRSWCCSPTSRGASSCARRSAGAAWRRSCRSSRRRRS